MDIERKFGIYFLIIGFISLILVFYVKDIMKYIFYIVSIPSLIYGTGAFLIPKVRRSKIGRIPFRGF